MKNGILLWMSAILVIGLSSCFCTKIEPEPTDAFEPNNTTAQAVLMPDSLEATMNEGEAPDVFAFDATAGQRIGLVFTQLSGSSLVLMAEIRAPDGTLIGNVERLQGYYGGSSSQPPLEFIAPTSGRYVLTLRGRYNGPPDSFCSVGRLRYRLQLQRPSTPSTPFTALPADLVGTWKAASNTYKYVYTLSADGSFVQQVTPIGCTESFVTQSERRGTVALDAGTLKFSETIGASEETYCPDKTKRQNPVGLRVYDLTWSLDPSKFVLTLGDKNYQRQP